MRRLLTMGLLAVGVAVPASVMQGDWWGDFWHRCHVDYHRNNAWPEPFQAADNQLAREALSAQVVKGWQFGQTLTTDYFVPATGELTPQGRRKLAWLVTQAPPQRRTVFVMRTADDAETIARLDSVQRAVSELIPAGPFPEVLATDVGPLPRSAEIPAAQYAGLRSTVSGQAPVLPASAGGTGASGGSSP